MVNAAHRELIDRLLTVAPALRPVHDEHVALNDELLPHVFFGDVTRFVIGALTSDDERARAEASNVIAILEVAMGEGNADVVNLISVSFIANLVGEEAPQRLRRHLGPRLTAEFDEQREPANQRLFVPLRGAAKHWAKTQSREGWCEARGRRVGPMTFEVLPPLTGVADGGAWEFAPGTVVTGQLWNLDGDLCLVAVRVADRLPALPPANPALRLSAAADVVSLRRVLQAGRPHSDFQVADVMDGASPVDEPRLLRDLAIRAYGEDLPDHARTTPPEQIWLPVTRDEGISLLVRALSTDQAYHDPVLDLRQATEIASSLQALFGDEASIFVNGEIDPRDGFLCSFINLRHATMETSVGFVSPARVGLVVITDED